MTPFARQLFRQMPARSGGARQLASAACFDTTAVLPTIAETIKGLVETRTDGPFAEHGGLLFLPAPLTWIETRDTAVSNGALVMQTENQIGYQAFTSAGSTVCGFIELQSDGETFCVRLDNRYHPKNPTQDLQHTNASIGFWVAASLLLINAPRGVEITSRTPHRGLARDVRNQFGGLELRPEHVITLSTKAGDVGSVGSAEGSPKAFHFCRSHLRRLPSGGSVRVRAHWRGDPTIGVSRATYRVAA